MFEFENIAFRPIERNDLDELKSLHNDQSTFLNLASIDLVDEFGQLAWWEGLHKNKTDKRYLSNIMDNADDFYFSLFNNS